MDKWNVPCRRWRRREELLKTDTAIKLYHVGGRGDTIGPADCLLRQLGNNVMLTVFEADPDVKDAGLQEGFDSNFGGKFFTMPRCLSDCVGRRNFYINEEADSSSLLKISPEAENYAHRGSLRWGQTCRTVKVIEVDVTTLDELYTSGELSLPDFLSIDAQGAEYDVMKGASKSLQGDLLGVVTEVEFREIYHGQKLFADQDALLRKHLFRLYELYNPQYWYPNPSFVSGRGALTVAEALYLRDFRYFIERGDITELEILLPKLLKLIIVSGCFGQYSYAGEIISYVASRWPAEWNSLIRENPNPYLEKITSVLNFNSPVPLPDMINLPYDARIIGNSIVGLRK